MTIDQETKGKDWFIKEPFLVPVGTKINYRLDGSTYIYTVNKEFMSDSKEDIFVKDSSEVVYNNCASPAWYVSFSSTASISFELPDTQVKTKTVLFKDQTTPEEIEFFPSTPTPGQFKAMQELADLSKDLYKGESLDDLWLNESEVIPISIPNAQGDEEFKPNSDGGIKFDSNKARPTLLLKSMPDAVQEVIDVLELGARKYAPDNWKKVENARYEDAELRHKLARFSGEKYDPETKKYHLAHEICNLMFLLQKEMEGLD